MYSQEKNGGGKLNTNCLSLLDTWGMYLLNAGPQEGTKQLVRKRVASLTAPSPSKVPHWGTKWGNGGYTYRSLCSFMPLPWGCLRNFPIAAVCLSAPKEAHNVSRARGVVGQTFGTVRHDTWTCLTAQFSETRTVFHPADMLRLTYLWQCVSTAHPHIRNICEPHSVKMINQHHGPDLTLHVQPSLDCWRAGGKRSHILLDPVS